MLYHSLLLSGQQETVIEQVEVHRFGGQLELRPRNAHHLSVHFKELTMFHQPTGLRDERKNLQRKKIQCFIESNVGNVNKEKKVILCNQSSSRYYLSLKMDFLIEMNKFLHPLH